MPTETSDRAEASVSETSEETGLGSGETGEGVSPYLRSIIVTTTAGLAGIGAGLVSTVVAASPQDRIGLVVVLAAIILQFPIYRLVGIDTSDFGFKDQLYVGLMTFVLWFISWGILLTAGSLQ